MSNIALPIYKSALALAVYMEQIVRGFEKYHKYTIGVDLRQKSKELLFNIGHANLAENKIVALTKLRDSCEEMKMLIQLSKELQAFKSFKQFEHSSLLAVTVCKQAQAWLNTTKRSRGGVALLECGYPIENSQSLQIRSVECANFTVRPFCLCA